MFPLAFPLLLAALTLATEPRTTTTTTTVPLGEVAQRAARIAIRTAGLSDSDLELDRMATRARTSALLPDLRVRATDTSAGPRDYISDTGTLATSYFGPSYVIEGSVTFHLDRLVYSGQEARIERLRLDRIEARARITQRVIDEVSRWSKATAEERDSPDGTDARSDAMAKRVAAQMALDVWTGGWFSAYLAGRAP